jgi:hypothetical protein
LTTTRKPISKKTRFEVFKRDGFKCMYCGAHPPGATLEVDHIKPVADGGSNRMDNLITSCFSCNRGKAANSLDNVPVSLAEKAEAVKEREAQIKGYEKAMSAKRERLDDQAQEIVTRFLKHPDNAPLDWMNSLRMFIDKLGFHEVDEAMDIALGKGWRYSDSKTWKYFCGICWNKLRRLEGTAG